MSLLRPNYYNLRNELVYTKPPKRTNYGDRRRIFAWREGQWFTGTTVGAMWFDENMGTYLLKFQFSMGKQSRIHQAVWSAEKKRWESGGEG